MGRYRSSSSDEDERSRKSKKRKKRRSRSSSIGSEQSHKSDRNRNTRRKHRRPSRSRSRSLDRKSSRSSRRSRSYDRYSSRKQRSRSRSSGRKGSSRRSRSPAYKHRSRSPSSRRPRSYSRSRSASRERRRRSRSYSRERSSHNGDRNYSGRSPVDRHKTTSQIPPSPKLKGHLIQESLSSSSIEMTPYEQAEERMRLALKAAASAGDKLRGSTIVDPVESKNFSASVAAIESDSFMASAFKSTRSNKVKEEPTDSGPTHDDAIFGSLAISGFTLTPDPDTKPIQLDPDAIMHQSLYCDPQEKMERWITRLSQLRRRKLEGDVIQ